jgi:hypothetical protein
LHHQSQLQFTEQWLDRANDSSLATDDNALANLQRLLTAETPGRAISPPRRSSQR